MFFYLRRYTGGGVKRVVDIVQVRETEGNIIIPAYRNDGKLVRVFQGTFFF